MILILLFSHSHSVVGFPPLDCAASLTAFALQVSHTLLV